MQVARAIVASVCFLREWFTSTPRDAPSVRIPPMSNEEKLERLLQMKDQARLGGGLKRIEAQHERGN